MGCEWELLRLSRFGLASQHFFALVTSSTQDAEAAKSFDTYKICVYHLLDWRNLPCCLLKALSDCVFHMQLLA